jgi:hypothetical protein
MQQRKFVNKHPTWQYKNFNYIVTEHYATLLTLLNLNPVPFKIIKRG